MESTYTPPTRALQTIQPQGTDGQIYNWSESSSPWRPLELLYLNHQIRSETLQLISQLYKNNRMSAELSIFAKGSCYTPKFTYLNTGLRAKSQLNLNVNLTILSTEHFRAHGGVTGFAFKTLVNFLSRFIFQGPTFLDHNPAFQTPGPFFIKTLSLNVAFQDDYTPATWPRTVHEIFRMAKGLSMLDTAPQYIGNIRVCTDYEYRGESIHREREWEVQPEESSTLKEEDWAAVDFYFGKSWVNKYSRCRS